MRQGDVRYLGPEAIYSLNRVLYEILDREMIVSPFDINDGEPIAAGKRAWVVPILFDPRTRSWHFACVDRRVWGGDEAEFDNDFLHEILWLLTKIAFRADLNRQFAGASSLFSEAKQNLLGGEDYLGAYTRIKD